MHALRVRLSCSGAGRRLLLFGILLGLAACLGPPAQRGEGPPPDPVLRFRPDGTFSIVHFTDTQDDQGMDPRTVRLIEAVLDDQRPDRVVFTGDNVRSGPGDPDEVHQAIDAFARPVEAPLFQIWAFDSRRYVPDTIAGQEVGADGLRTYDWIRPSQVAWYVGTSRELEARYGRKISGLMFFHIPLPEFDLMRQHRENHRVTGEKNEDVAAGAFNSGLFGAVMARGGVVGIFVGHDHVNDFVGSCFGVRLGYSANTGFGSYGLDGEEPDRLRGARVFVLREGDPADFDTHMVYARDYGIQ